MRARAGSLALVACALSGAWAAPARGPVLDTAAYARRQAGQLPRTSAAAPPAEQWADRLVAPLWLYAQDLAEGDELEAVESIDVDGAASVLYKVSVENRFADGAFIVHHLGNGSAKLSYDAVLPLEAQDWEALALAAERQAGLLRMGLKSSAAGRLVDVAGVLRAAWLHEVAAGRAPEAAWDELLADWSYFGFKQDGVETGPSIGARARAQSLRYLRRQASQLEPAGAAPAESRAAARALWLAAQKTCADTQFLLTGEQIDAAARAAYPGLVGVRAQSRVNTSRARWAWELLESMTREEVRPRRRSGEGLWAALDPYAAMNLADILEKLARTPRAARLQTPKPGAAARPLFEDVTERSGLGVRSADALDKVSVGAAFLDYDQDGRPDVFVRMGRKGGRLFRNLGGFRFKDVTDAAGLSLSGARAFAADYDNDGYPDLFVLGAYGGVNRLFHNERNRTFKDVTAKAGLVQSPELAVSAVWLDFDDDGLLDLYVVHAGRYVDGVTPSGPTSDNGLPNRLYRNKGDGTFEDVTAKAGVGDPHWGWAAAALDYDGDGLQDLFVCNCFGPSVLYRNKGDGTFEDATRAAGVDVPTLCKGVSVGDYNHDGRMDLFVTAVSSPQGRVDYPFVPARFSGGYVGSSPWRDRLFENRGAGRFEDVYTERFPEGGAGWGWNGFFADYDLDGWQDVVEVNGFYPDVLFYHDERKQLFRYDPAAGRFVFERPGNGADLVGVSRGSAFADLDGDGCPDLLYVGLHGPRLLRGLCNAVPKRHWLRVALRGTRSNRDGIGATVRVRAGNLEQAFAYGSEGGGSVSSFAGSLLVGLGGHAKADAIEVRWPSGRVQVLRDQAADRALTIAEDAP